MSNVVVSINVYEVLSKYENELLAMHPEDLEFVLGIILPMGSDIDTHKEEIMRWQHTNQDTMKK
jgi:hypothetical protein